MHQHEKHNLVQTRGLQNFFFFSFERREVPSSCLRNDTFLWHHSNGPSDVLDEDGDTLAWPRQTTIHPRLPLPSRCKNERINFNVLNQAALLIYCPLSISFTEYFLLYLVWVQQLVVPLCLILFWLCFSENQQLLLLLWIWQHEILSIALSECSSRVHIL